MKFSIITINYNNKAGLQRTIDSVVCQTWKEYEWLLIDGGSTDGSKELIEQYQEYFAYWCSEPDKGIYNAMNKGAVKAKGEYLLFLNSGDALYDKNVLQQVSDLHLDTDIISGQVERMDNHQLLRIYDENILKYLYFNTLNHQGTFIKRLLFDELKYDEDLMVVSDWKFWLDTIIWKNASFMITDLKIARQDMTGVSSIDVQQDIKERRKVLDAYFPFLIQRELKSYWGIVDTVLFQRSEYLKNNSHIAYIYGIRLLGILVKIVKFLKRINQ